MVHAMTWGKRMGNWKTPLSHAVRIGEIRLRTDARIDSAALNQAIATALEHSLGELAWSVSHASGRVLDIPALQVALPAGADTAAIAAAVSQVIARSVAPVSSGATLSPGAGCGGTGTTKHQSSQSQGRK